MSDLVKRLRGSVYRCPCDGDGGQPICPRCKNEELAAERIEALEALCGRALKELREDEPSSIGPGRKPLMAELKKAAKK